MRHAVNESRAWGQQAGEPSGGQIGAVLWFVMEGFSSRNQSEPDDQILSDVTHDRLERASAIRGGPTKNPADADRLRPRPYHLVSRTDDQPFGPARHRDIQMSGVHELRIQHHADFRLQALEKKGAPHRAFRERSPDQA